MATAAFSLSLSSPSNNLNHRFSSHNHRLTPSFATVVSSISAAPFSLSSSHSPSLRSITRHLPFAALSPAAGDAENSVGGDDGTSVAGKDGTSVGGDDGNFVGGDDGNSDGGAGGGDDGESGGGEDGGDGSKRNDAVLALAEIGRSLDSLPKDLAVAIEEGRIPVDIVRKYLELEKSPLFKWLLQFGGFRDRLLADDLFFAKLAMECGVGVFTKTAAEYERRRENFFKELEIVGADVAMAIIADFMLVYLPAPTVALKPSLAMNAGPIAKFFHGCPDNAFQIALGGAQYSLIQRIGAILRNGAKLFAVGTTSSLVGTAITNGVINARKAVDKSAADDVENVPIVSTSVAYGVYMAVSSNLRYQIVAGVIEQRILEPMLHNQKLLLSAVCFAVRTGNTFLGSLLWVDYARWIGIQKVHDEHPNAEPGKA